MRQRTCSELERSELDKQRNRLLPVTQGKKSIVLTILSQILRNYHRRQIIEIRYKQSQGKMLHAQLADARSAECHCTSAISDHFRKALWTFLQSAGNRAIFVISSEHVSLIPSTNRQSSARLVKRYAMMRVGRKDPDFPTKLEILLYFVNSCNGL